MKRRTAQEAAVMIQKQGGLAGGRYRKRAAVTGTLPWGRMPQHGRLLAETDPKTADAAFKVFIMMYERTSFVAP